ncbi:hypothetical protein MBLNU459_g6448t1 [Dothideomycetes sp. NU459]
MSPIFFLVGLAYISGSFAFQTQPFGSSFGLPGVNATYDYVIIGGGTAGLAVATRLAQNSTFSVAVIEAGSFYELDNGNYSQIPFYDYESASDTSLDGVNGLIDWRFETTPQPAEGGRVFHYTRGKCLGGSSARNYMAYNRGTVGQFQQWADQVGDDSYQWDSVLPYYKRSALFTPANTELRAANATPGDDSSAFSPQGGPLQVSYANYASPFSSYLKAAWNEMGLSYLPQGFNTGRLIGHTYTTSTIDPKDETRSSSQTSYLTLALESTALTVYTHAMAKKIVFDANKTATGVIVDVAGMTFSLNATKEVILSAGAFQSPQMLMVSGVGPASMLAKYDIPVIADRAGVGQQMWDNPIIIVDFATDFPTPSIEADTLSYLQNRSGPLTSSGADYFGCDKLSNKPQANLTDATRSSLEREFASDWPEYEIASFGSALAIGILTTFSRGSVTINSSDSADAPIIDPGWLSDARDQDLAVAVLKIAREVANTTALRQVISAEVAPGPAVQTDAQILEYILGSAGTFFHASATNKMGKANDSMAVVDSDAKVIGVQGLRVVDISAFPLLPPGQPQATVYMLAEKIADRILDDAWKGCAWGTYGVADSSGSVPMWKQ